MSQDRAGGAGKLAGQLSAANRRALLKDLLRDRKGAEDRDRIPRRTLAGPLPLSFAQQRLWVVDRLDPGSAAYNIPSALRLRGALDTAALRASLDALVRRHESLRTTFEERGGVPAQVVHPPARVTLPLVDLRGAPDAARRAERLAAEEARRPFDLQRGPLLRSSLLRLAEDDHVLCFTLHHIVSDGWSTDVLVREVSALYAAFSRGEEPSLPELPVQYADFAAWQREQLTGEALEAQIGWWRENLAGAPPLLEIPTERPRAAGQSPSAGSHRFALPASLADGLRALTRSQGSTLFMTVLAGWQALLGRYAAQDDVVVGTPIAGRTRAELEGLIGFFVNTLALRGELGGDPTWRELLARVKRTAVGAFGHQELPFERLVEELGVERSLTHSPVFQVMFALSRASRHERLSLGGLALEQVGDSAGVAKFDLNLAVGEGEEGEGLDATLVYRAALFEAEAMARMAAHLETVLEAMVAAPERRLSEVSLLRDAERARLLAEWRPGAPLHPAACLHELFARQAEATPDAPAISFGGEALTYAELERASNRLANALRARGVGPEVPVAVCVERGVEMMVGVLGVLKAGGAYVPLDPAYPAERLAYTLADSGAGLLLTQDRLLGALPAFGGEVVRLDADREATAAGPHAAPRSGVGPGNAAYVIYTSGSTGRPKGVVVEHASLAATLLGMRDLFGLGAGETVPAMASYAFDIWLVETFPSLLSGGQVRMLAGETVRDVERLVEELAGVDGMHAVPALMREIVARVRSGPGTLPRMRRVFVGGDAVPPDLLGQMQESFPGAQVVVMYGPTEATMVSAASRVGPEDGAGWQRMGRALPGEGLYVCDAGGSLLPAGVPGELWIGGAGVARGYLGRPELTAAQFVPDPFGGEAGARAYRTGDRVRRRLDGELEFLGRTDAQVKVRGFRIEPGEIEAALLAQEGVHGAAVVVREDTPGHKRLVAYVVPEEGAEVSTAELRARLGGRLPEHMVPGAIVVLEQMPLNANGKTDRRALPAPEQEAAAYVAPATAAEEVLAGIWAEVLGRERVGVEASFFELGGHSLLATQVVSRARQAFGVEVPLRALFEAPTVSALAARVEALRGEGGAAAPPIARVPREAGEALPLSFAQQRLWLVDRLEPGSAAYNMPSALRLRGVLHTAALRGSLDELVRRHEALRTTFAERDGEPVQVIHPAAPVALEELDLRGLPEAEREAAAERLAAGEARRPFDLARGPLLRSTLLRLADDDHVLLLTLHHVVSDGWSMGVLTREVFALYDAFSRGESSPLPELPLQYADYALWQREWLSGETLERQLAWWRERMAGAPALLELPTDRPRPALPSHRAAERPLRVDAALAGGLRALGRREGVTPFMILLAGFAVVLGRWAGQADVVVGTPIASRTRRETEGLIGFFLNTLALRTDLSGDPSFRELLARVRETTLGAYAHQDLPFERVLEELQPARSLSHSPLFQVMLNLQNFNEEEAPGLARLSAEPFGEGTRMSKFDLTLYAAEGEEGMLLNLVYAAELFEDARMAEMLEQLRSLLAQVVEDPERPLAAYSLRTPAALAALPDPALPLPAAWHGPVHAQFAAQARRSPERVALRDAHAGWSYGELEARSGRLARWLLAQGLRREEPVAIHADRGAPLVWAMLGVLGAGGAFVVLDPAYPPARLERQLRAARPRVLLQVESAGPLSAGVEAWLAGSGAIRLVLPARPAADFLSGHSTEAPGLAVGPEDAAYVAFTSGTTGEPKGIVGTHRPLSHFVAWQRETFGLGADDRFALLSGLAHDPLLRDVFTPLSLGATLCIPDPREMGTPGYLARWMAAESVTAAHLTPAMGQLLREGGEGLPALRHVFWGGDKVRAGDVAALRQRAPGAGSVVFYGATETPQAISFFPVPPEWSGPEVLPVGRGVEGVQLLVLTPADTLAGVGEVGEICVRTPYLARGYLHDEPGAPRRFVVNPFGGGPADRVYRTGDLGRYRPDGTVQILGRADAQVKVRGFRIEPGEIEAALREHTGVREAAVVLHDAGSEPRLVGYVVPAGAAPAADELREHVRSRLPDYMVPGAFMVLDALPLTPNGKLDRRALPAPDVSAGPEYAAPRTATEETLAGLWAETLRVERVGARDDFFALGGHSLLATRLVSRVRDALGVELPLRAFFEAPTVEALAARVDALQREGGRASLPPVRPVPRDGSPLPLSFAQQRLWVVDQLEPGSPAYNMPFALRLRGALDAAALRASLDALARRHETLRTTFGERGGEPVQVVHPPAPVPLPVHDLRDLPAGERGPAARRLAGEEALRPFDLARGPLLRAALLRLGNADHVLCFTLHHVVSDAWSMQVLVREVSALYAAFSRGEEPGLPELPVQYADYAVWQREWLSGETLDAHVGFWKDGLAGAPPLLEIPTDGPRRPGQSPREASHPFVLPAGVSDGLRALSRREGATLFMTVLAAWQALLGRYAAQEDVVVGSAIAGRSRLETEGLIGFFVNMLALRGDLAGDPTGTELLGRVRETALGAYAHQELPFERLVEELSVERSLTHSPVFQVTFALNRPAEQERLALGELELEAFGAADRVARYDLGLVVADQPGTLAATLDYREALFEAGTIARMAGHLETLLEAMAADPRRRLSEVPLLRGAERAQVLEAWNATAADFPRERCIHELFAAQAARTPGAVAVVSGDRTLTYAELEGRSTRLAHRLAGLGVRPEARVGLCLERGAEMVVALLGVLKAGGAYLPLDPSYPPERLAYMLADSGASVLLTQSRLAAALPAFAGPRLCLDAESAALAGEPASAPAAADPESAAYVIYTSGSTGTPKGVVVPHRAVVNFLDSMRARPGLSAGDTLLAVTTLSFDIAALELFLPLTSGARVVVADRETASDGARLREAIAASGATVMQATPASWRMLLEAGWEGAPGLRALCGGEALPRELADRLLAAVAELWNLYGPTETTIWSTVERVEPGEGAVSIGSPIANTRLYLLDGSLEPVPAGVPGELYIGGEGVARGYLGRPELTAERFVPDAFSREPGSGARLYRTGDRVRRRVDGTLEYLGRTDHQVKVRGFRIELGEIDAALCAQPQVREAVAVVRDGAHGDRRLVAYVAAEDGAALTAAELRSSLRERLPEHMVPGAFVVLDRLPLTANGKVDRRALPAPELESTAYVAPRTAAEEVLAGIWAAVLGVERVGVEAGFFEMGGHSLLATRVVSRARQAFGVEVPLRALFEAPTVAALAERIEALRSAGATAALPIARAPRTGPLPVSFAQQRLWVVDRLDPDSPAYNLSSALRLRGELDAAALRASLDALVRRHETLRTTFAEQNGTPVQVIHPAAPAPLPVVDLRELLEAERQPLARRLAGEESLRPFDLARGPLLRGTLLRLGDTDHVLCFTLHHVVSDAWSMQVLVREVSALYAAFSRGEASPLPELPVQYADYAVWQREWMSGAVLEEQLGFWRDRLGGAPPLLTLPTDRPRSAVRKARAGTHRFVVSAGVSQGLRALSRSAGTTLFMTLLAGWQALLGRYAGQEDVVVGSPIAGRDRRDTEGLIGFFVNMLALRADLGADPTWTELLDQVRETALGAYEHQELPFERLVDELVTERSPTHSPLFQVVFALDRSSMREALSLGEVEVEPFGGGERTARFDLTLTMVEAEEGLGGTLTYRAGLYEAGTAARMAAHLEAVLEAMAAAPERRLSELSLLRGAERAQLLHAWNGADTGYSGELCMHELVHAQVLRTPDAPALRFEEQRFTYAELFRRSCQLANLLRREGVGPETRVGICMEAAPEMVVSVLGVLLAGGAYLPLDPELPTERRAYMLGDAAPALLLTQTALAERLADAGIPLLRVDAEAERISRESDEAPVVDLGPDNLAYVIYTSGSTGRPKGVLVEHRGVGNTFLELGRVYGAAPGERNLAYAPLHFDASVADIFVALCNGAELVLARREAMLPGEDLVRLLREQRITHLKTMPSALAVTPVEELPDLKVIVTGGEVLPAEQVRRWGAGRTFFNGYGATEASIRMTSSACTAEGGDPPIGRAVANTQLYVLDALLEPVPVGVAGELYIGGVGVVRGYLGRPDLTAERFLPDPHRGVAGARLYRTGDVGRRRADGEVEFLGRSDFQVKVRGYRVELGEIEAVLRAHPQVREAVVLLREDVPGQQRLVAYVTGQDGADATAAEVRGHLAGLRAYLAERVPEYMVPGAFVVLEQLPVTANGKIDRRALPAPERPAEAEFVAPRTAVEELLAGIWAELLGLERVGVTENFFGLGGHSLVATQVVSRLRKTLGIEVPLSAMFELPTVEALTRIVEDRLIGTLDADQMTQLLELDPEQDPDA